MQYEGPDQQSGDCSTEGGNFSAKKDKTNEDIRPTLYSK